jgi:tetratricopeptide (TPR) repeat protein
MRGRLLVGFLGLQALGLGWTAHATELRAPQNLNGAPGSRQSAEFATRAAASQMNGRPAEALALAEQGIRADADDPWPYYSKAMALSELGQIDAAAAAFQESERRFLPGDLWGKSVALYGRGHAYAQAGRCAEAQKAFDEYASVVSGYDAKGVALVHRYVDECRASLRRPNEAPPDTAPAVPAR